MKTFIHRRPSIGKERYEPARQIGVEVAEGCPVCKCCGVISKRAISIGALAVGALSMGALAIGAVAFGRLVIGRLLVGKGKIDKLDIGSLKIGSLEVVEPLTLNEADRSPAT
ncbi:MAG TPA: hypothetical protein VN371_05400 [Chlorobaculum sp.]|nr:hypothetical protein [Chlorobaculum sp.]